MSNKDTHQTLQRVYEALKKTPSELAKAINVSPQTITNWSNRGVSKSGAITIANTFDLSVDYILTGQEEVNLSKQQNISKDFEKIDDWDDSTPLDPDEIEVPFYKSFAFACGHGTDGVAMQTEKRKLRISRHTIDRIGSHRDNIFVTTADGDSMSPTIKDGSTIWVDTSKKNIKDGKIFVFEYGGLFMCKRLYRLPNNGLRVVSDNNIDYKNFEISGEDREKNGFNLIGWVWHWSVIEHW